MRATARAAAASNTDAGQIEYAEAGSGFPLLSIHGAGGGFDQGLANAAELAGEGFLVARTSGSCPTKRCPPVSQTTNLAPGIPLAVNSAAGNILNRSSRAVTISVGVAIFPSGNSCSSAVLSTLIPGKRNDKGSMLATMRMTRSRSARGKAATSCAERQRSGLTWTARSSRRPTRRNFHRH